MQQFLRSVFLIGTDHRYQERQPCIPEATHAAFEDLLRRCIRENDLRAIAEEHSHDALSGKSLSKTVLESLAVELGLPHRYCDPSVKQSMSLGILQENEIRLKDWPRTQPTEQQVAEELATGYRKREAWWLQELIKLNEWPCLFVCGSEHTIPFAKLLEQSGVVVHVVAADWNAP